MKITFGLVLLSVALVNSQSCLTPNDNRPPNPNSKSGLYNGQQEFSLALLQAINQLNPDANLFFSPYSTYHALLLAYFISGSQTEGYLRKALKLNQHQDKADVFNAYKLDKFATQLRSKNASYEFSNANRIYVDKSVEVRSCMSPLFLDELQSVDFQKDPEVARMGINSWVEAQTRDMIKDLLPGGTIDQNTDLVLVNAAYFKGIWENKFDPALTKPDVFHITPSKRTFVDMMHVEGTFNHDVSEDLMAHILELPYQGGDISMYILLPPFAKEDGIPTILKRLTLERFKSIVDENSSLSARTVQVSVPKFSLEHTIQMVPILEALGVGNLFTSSSDFSTLTNSNVSLGDAFHKAKIEVTEEGTKAAAATVLFTFRSSRPAEPAQFNCNHPFVYVIYDKVEKALLFTGVFRRPY
ncbi:PREDICTED: serpin B4-like isoform X2 [Nicrophorus vespilloides]|uniref:Serpin B4-like isoform X2 n=1 Tax=Nicrophorus vespilloides TaxID=110193 RepID=A0ABM1M264_NICVS|nr:PREDICTED: serpin B4-like isoform X2 [Nicrophorus vespilloides]